MGGYAGQKTLQFLFCPFPVAALSSTLVSYTINFTITNLQFMPDMSHPGSSRFNKTEAILQHLVRALRCSQPTAPHSSASRASDSPASPPSPAWCSDEEHQHRPTLLWLQTELSQVGGSGKALTPSRSPNQLLNQPCSLPSQGSSAGPLRCCIF